MRRLILISAVLAAASPATAAECVQVTLRDVNGLPVKSEAPIVGFVIPGVDPIVNQTLPAGVTTQAGTATPCPADLVAAVQSVFNDNCTTDKGRQSATDAYAKDDQDLVKQRCQALYKALNP
jgi:hypothetical protein